MVLLCNCGALLYLLSPYCCCCFVVADVVVVVSVVVVLANVVVVVLLWLLYKIQSCLYRFQGEISLG